MKYFVFLEKQTNKKIKVNEKENILIKYLLNNKNYTLI
jgi:hypothetical protein